MWEESICSAIQAMYLLDLTWILGTWSGGSSYSTTVMLPVFLLRPMYCLYGPCVSGWSRPGHDKNVLTVSDHVGRKERLAYMLFTLTSKIIFLQLFDLNQP